MSQLTNSVCELEPTEASDLYAPRPDPHALRPDPVDSRTLLKRYFLDPVLPVLTLLSMSALTIVLLVTIVTTVAEMDLQLPNGYVDLDPWAGPAGTSYPDQTYTDAAPSLESATEGDLWAGPQQTRDPL